MKIGQLVVVTDTSNYEVSENTPFFAKIKKITDYPCYWVKSESTGELYELYDFQFINAEQRTEI